MIKTDTKSLKEQADEYLDRAKGLITLDQIFFPMVYAVTAEKTTPVSLKNDTEEDTQEISEVMEIVAHNSEAVILVIDTDLIDAELDPGEEIDPKKLSEDPRTMTALVCFLHTKTESFMRQLRYISNEDGVIFCDLDWEKADEMTGKFDNPFKKN